MLRRTILLSFLLWNSALHAQNLETITKAKAVGVSGSIGLQDVFYQAKGMDPRRDPNFWAVNGNATITLYETVRIPLNFFFSQQQRGFTQNYNQFGFSPNYKGITAHVGHRSMFFSNYSLSGLTFLGAGIEVKPEGEKWEVAAMYGRLAKAIEVGRVDGVLESQPSFSRTGFGTKIKYGTKDKNIAFNLFKASDDAASIRRDSAMNIYPEESLTLGLSANFKLDKRLNFSGEFANSMFTADTESDELFLLGYSYANNFGPLFTPRQASRYNNAFKLGLNHTNDLFVLGLSFEHVDPEYRSLGAVYLNNDRQNLLLNLSTGLWKNKISLSGNFGTERNNLANDLNTTMLRLVGGGNMNFSIDKHWNLSANYSNFRTSSEPTLITFVDSLAYRQVSQNAGGILAFSHGSKVNAHRVNLGYNYQLVNDNLATNSAFSNINLGYTLSLANSGLSIFTSLNHSAFEAATTTNNINSLTLGASKSLLKKKLKLTFNSALNDSKTGGVRSNFIQNHNLQLNYKPAKSHSIGLANNIIINAPVDPTMERTSEFRLTLRYVYNFSI